MKRIDKEKEVKLAAKTLTSDEILDRYGEAGGLLLADKFLEHIYVCSLCQRKVLEIIEHADYG